MNINMSEDVFLTSIITILVRWVSVVGRATRYGAGRSGFRIAWWRGTPGAHPPFCKMDTGSLSQVKRLGRGVEHPSLYSVEALPNIQIYLYSPSGH